MSVDFVVGAGRGEGEGVECVVDPGGVECGAGGRRGGWEGAVVVVEVAEGEGFGGAFAGGFVFADFGCFGGRGGFEGSFFFGDLGVSFCFLPGSFGFFGVRSLSDVGSLAQSSP